LGAHETAVARRTVPGASPAAQVDADWLPAIMLTEADLAGDLHVVAEQSGPVTSAGQRGYFAVFTHPGLFEPERLPQLPAGTLLAVMCDLAIPVSDRGPEDIEERA